MTRAIPLSEIEEAALAMEGAIVKTPCSHSRTLSALTGAEIWIKFENLQFTAAFKERGALNKLRKLSEAERKAGVIAMSAGNHAQGVAYHANRMGIPAVIVMPMGTPNVKVEQTEGHGAEVILHGDGVAEAGAYALEMAAARGMTFVHPYDDVDVMAGQGTIALEMLHAAPDLDCLVVPIGGGGLISGMASAAKAVKPEIDIFGVEAEKYASAYNALHQQGDVIGGTTLAEGIAVKTAGQNTQPFIEDLVKEILLVSEAKMEEAISLYLQIEKTVAEGAGAAGLAAVLSNPETFAGRKVGLVICGGNIDTRVLSNLLMRQLVRTGRIARLKFYLPDVPGQLTKVSEAIGDCGGNILEVLHQRLFSQSQVNESELDIVVEARDAAHMTRIVQACKDAGLVVQLMDGGPPAH